MIVDHLFSASFPQIVLFLSFTVNTSKYHLVFVTYNLNPFVPMLITAIWETFSPKTNTMVLCLRWDVRLMGFNRSLW